MGGPGIRGACEASFKKDRFRIRLIMSISSTVSQAVTVLGIKCQPEIRKDYRDVRNFNYYEESVKSEML